MKNYIQRGDTLSLTAPADLLSGEIVVVGDLIGVASHDAPNGTDVQTTVSGVFTLPKAAGALSQGVKAYWDSTNSNVVGTASGNKYLGHVTAPAATEDTVAEIRLIG